MLHTPSGTQASNIDRVMLLAMWAKALSDKDASHPVINCGMGKPTFPLNPAIQATALEFWEQQSSSIDYGSPQGEYHARYTAAQALNQWYQLDCLTPQDILFTVGGAGALYCIFSILQHKFPTGRIITPKPYYSLYQGYRNSNRLVPIDLISSPGYRLRAELLESTINQAQADAELDHGFVSAILLCDPNNPLGTHLDKNEILSILEILEKHPNILIIIDGAYEEMILDGEKHPTLFSLASDTLRQRMILLRSATKAFSAAGARLAALITTNQVLMSELVSQHIALCGHAPIPSQLMFASALKHLSTHGNHALISYYRSKVNLVTQRLSDMGASLPDPRFKTQATFYVCADLHELLGFPKPASMMRSLEGNTSNGNQRLIKTDEDLVYSLMFESKIMICPLSYFGVNPKLGYVRITCSVTESELEKVMDCLEAKLIDARETQNKALKQEISSLAKLSSKNITLPTIPETLNSLPYAIRLLREIQLLQKFLQRLKAEYSRSSPEKVAHAAVTIQAFFRGHQARKHRKIFDKTQLSSWIRIVNSNFDDPETRLRFYRFSPSQRLTFKPWRDYLQQNSNNRVTNSPPTSFAARL